VKVLIVVAYYLPEIGSAAHIYADLARAFVQRGHEVDVITSYPREYNLNGPDRTKVFDLDEEIDGVQVHRVAHANVRDSIVMRGLEHFLLSGYYFRRYRELGKTFDVALFYIPPLPLFHLAEKIKKADGTPSVLNYQDFHPQELTDVGVMKNPILIKLMERIERRSYRNADFITVLSAGGIDYVVRRGARPEKVAHIFNSVSMDDIDPYLQRKSFKQGEGLEGRFLVSYAGILSPYQGIDNILDAAKGLEDHPEVTFCIAGDGSNRDHIATRIANENITNVRMVPFLPRDEYFNLVNSSDVGLISLDERMKAPCLPGKTVNLMAAGKPVVAIVPEDCETARTITEAGCGRIVTPGDITTLRETVTELMNHPETMHSMGKSGRNYLVRHMNLERSVQSYEDIFSDLVQQRSRT
jgi:glycosyltransferase involved in cell wall biosynthesis